MDALAQLVIGAVLSFAGGAWIARRSANRQARREAARSFRPVVAEALSELDNGTDPFAVMSRHGTKLDAAVLTVRSSLSAARRARLDTAATVLSTYRATLDPGFLRYLEWESTGQRPQDVTPQLTHTLRELLALADAA